jgi:hypothetical protein
VHRTFSIIHGIWFTASYFRRDKIAITALPIRSTDFLLRKIYIFIKILSLFLYYIRLILLLLYLIVQSKPRIQICTCNCVFRTIHILVIYLLPDWSQPISLTHTWICIRIINNTFILSSVLICTPFTGYTKMLVYMASAHLPRDKIHSIVSSDG